MFSHVPLLLLFSGMDCKSSKNANKKLVQGKIKCIFILKIKTNKTLPHLGDDNIAYRLILCFQLRLKYSLYVQYLLLTIAPSALFIISHFSNLILTFVLVICLVHELK